MTRKILSFVLFVLAAGHAATSLADAPPPATPPVAPTHDPDAVKFLRELENEIQTQTDDQAVASVKRLTAFWKDPAVKDATKKPIPGIVAWYARRKSQQVALAGISGLADIGKGEGARNLVDVLDAALKRDGPPANVTDAVFAALKRVADPDPAVIDALVKLLVHHDDVVVARAADALGGYGGAAFDVRRDLLDLLIRTFEGVAARASQSGKNVDKSAMTRWATVGSAVVGAMNALAHQQFANPAAARRWFNDHHRDADAWK